VCNGWVDDRRARNLSYTRLAETDPPLPDGGRDITADHLRHEALVFVYRILFCLYAEARGGELGILPINDDVYRLGYSLEALRDLTSPRALVIRDGEARRIAGREVVRGDLVMLAEGDRVPADAMLVAGSGLQGRGECREVEVHGGSEKSGRFVGTPWQDCASRPSLARVR
jgi:hypothetical protein